MIGKPRRAKDTDGLQGCQRLRIETVLDLDLKYYLGMIASCPSWLFLIAKFPPAFSVTKLFPGAGPG